MATILQFPTVRKPVTHYAVYGEIEGTATLLNGSGYLFRKGGERRATLVSYTDPELVLCGRCDLADTQLADDLAAGGYAAIACGRGR